MPRGRSAALFDIMSSGSDSGSEMEPCACCFDLDARAARAAADEESDAITTIEREGVVLVKRTMGDVAVASVTGDCEICFLLAEVLEFFGVNPQARDYTERRIRLRIPQGSGNLEVSFQGMWSSTNYVQLFIARGPAWKRIQPMRDISNFHMSEESLSFIRTCLLTCLEKHTLCRRKEEGLPARILDLGKFGDSTMRLIDFDDNMDSGTYVALSYCWGDGVTLKTTSTNIDSIKSSVTVADLPEAYIDAISLTRRLGIRYLWIDALCIIQDVHADWEAESAKLAGIYGNAFLTIAGASSSSADQAFLRRQPQPWEPVTVSMQTRVYSKQVDSSTMLKARLITDLGVHAKWEETRRDDTRDRWSRRGWTLQEQLLSTRLLCFSNTEMQFSCQEGILCECHSRLNIGRLFGDKAIAQMTSNEEAYRYWHKVLENYTSRDLTNPTDKLTAISGVASQVQRKTQSRYTAGLWVDNIHLELLWRARDPFDKAPSTYLAPTFSWGSIQGEADYCCFRNGNDPFTKVAKILSIEAGARPEAPLGVVTSGRLEIQGPVVEGIIQEGEQKLSCLVAEFAGTAVEALPDCQLGQVMAPGLDGTTKMTLCRRYQPDPAQEQSNGKSVDEDDMDNKLVPVARFWALRVGFYKIEVPDVYPSLEVHEFLLLGKSAKNPEQFERIGAALLYNEEGYEEEFENVKKNEEIMTITVL